MHLVVIHHGLWGVPKHMGHLETKLREKFPETIEILNFEGNSGTKTYDGVDVCGLRLTTAVTTRLKDDSKPKIERISFIGYSLGGLVIRYAIGMLEARRVFSGEGAVVPANFITVAAPHAGAAARPTTMWARLYNNGQSSVLSRSGRHLTLTDNDGDCAKKKGEDHKTNREKDADHPGGHDVAPPTTVTAGDAQPHDTHHPLLLAMADPALPFWQGLSRFRLRRTFANTLNDRVVGFTTSSLETSNHYRRPGATYSVDPKYPSIVVLGPTSSDTSNTATNNAATPFPAPPSSRPASTLQSDTEGEPDEEDLTSSINDTSNAPGTPSLLLPDPVDSVSTPRPTFSPFVSKTDPRLYIFYCMLPLLAPIALTALGTMHVIASVRNWRDVDTPVTLSQARSELRAYVAAVDAATAMEVEDGTDYEGVRDRIIRNLNRVKWEKVHVRIPHRRAHAAIVARPDYDFYADVMEKLVDEFVVS
ncbi:hypothetical protein HKX48_008460 [Thoreauomyces humboldtii]|nr:hypothetical protein HKX48_008460 [Thoreauomyces humboldtii]